MNHKELVRKMLRGREILRPPFIPLLGTYLTKVDQISAQDLLTDPGMLYSGLIHTQQLLSLDAVTLPVDHALEAEAFGALIQWEEKNMPAVKESMKLDANIVFNEETWLHQGRIPVFLEAVKRFAAVHGKTIPLFATITGPITVLQQLYGDEAIKLVIEKDIDMLERLDKISHALLSLCKSYGELKVDGVIIVENISLDLVHPEVLKLYYNPMFTVLRFYNTVGLYKLPSKSSTLLNIPSDGIMGVEYIWNIKDYETYKNIRGFSLSSNNWYEEIDFNALRDQFKRNGNKNIFITTEDPLNVDIDMNQLQTKVRLICEEDTWS